MMGLFQSLGFVTPLALVGLVTLPVIWWLLRFTPPRPERMQFPPIRILLGLTPQEETSDKTPWWLLALRLALATSIILAVAQPFLQPGGTLPTNNGLRLVVVDNGWAAAANWNDRSALLEKTLTQSQIDNAPVVLAFTSPTPTPQELKPSSAAEAFDTARLTKPSALPVDRLQLLDLVQKASLQNIAAITWIADGLDAGSATKFVEGLRSLSPSAKLRILGVDAGKLPLALSPFAIEGNDIKVKVVRTPATAAGTATVAVQAINGRTLLEVPATLGSDTESVVSFSLPTTLRNEIQSISISGQEHAGARQLLDDRWRKRAIALLANESAEQSQLLLSPLHYLRRGLEPFAELSEPRGDAELQAAMDAGLSALVMADIGQIPLAQQEKITPWIENGGILIRFAGPHLAVAHDDLLPVALRAGDRTLGSALSWDVPQGMQPFTENSPFAGLDIDPAVKVTRQVLAEPDPDVASRTWASLDDGTPLVTAVQRGKGLIVLFHVTANANWSNLPLSGLFLQMMQRVARIDPASAQQVSNKAPDSEFILNLMLNGQGNLVPSDGAAKPIPATKMDEAIASAATPPGLYQRKGREQALNLKLGSTDLTAMGAEVGGVPVEQAKEEPRVEFAPYLFAAAMLLLIADSLATLLLGGAFRRGNRRAMAGAVTSFALVVLLMPVPTHAQQQPPLSERQMQAALSPRLAYVTTGDDAIDRTSREGLKGLTAYLTERTSATLAEADAVNVSEDDIVLYPLIYWPVPEKTEPLDSNTRQKISAYIRNGGTILFDTRDGGLEETNLALQTLLSQFDLPPLEPVPDGHVLTRSFYLLEDFPGRFEGPRPWVEALAVTDDGTSPGTADGVSGIIIGSNDYAAAWAIDDAGQPLYAMVPGTDRQREFAVRTGINIVMYALTGNYKADQVHVPALLERLGQ